MGPINYSVCHWQAFTALYSQMFKLNGPMCMVQRKLSFVNTVAGIILTTFHHIFISQMGETKISLSLASLYTHVQSNVLALWAHV